MAAEQQQHHSVLSSPRSFGSPLRIFTTEDKKKRKAIRRFINKFTTTNSPTAADFKKSDDDDHFDYRDSTEKSSYTYSNSSESSESDEEEEEETLSSLIKKEEEDETKTMEKLQHPNNNDQPSENGEKNGTPTPPTRPILNEEVVVDHEADNKKEEQVYDAIVEPKERDDNDTASVTKVVPVEYEKPSEPSPPVAESTVEQQSPINNEATNEMMKLPKQEEENHQPKQDEENQQPKQEEENHPTKYSSLTEYTIAKNKGADDDVEVVGVNELVTADGNSSTAAASYPPLSQPQEDNCFTSLAKGLQHICGGGGKR